MSLVERALNKLKEAGLAAAGTAPAGGAKPMPRWRQEATVKAFGSVVDTQELPQLPLAAGRSSLIVQINHNQLRAAGLMPPTNQERRFADEYRRIKRPLVAAALAELDHPEKTHSAHLIMMSSAMPGEGKTFMSINLALSMATERDVTVLLVDGDVAKPNISHLFGVEAEPGLIDLLQDSSLDAESLILRTDIPGLSILPAGTYSELATELLASERMTEIVRRLGQRDPRRMVLFDSPPVLLTSESEALADACGQIVMVVKAGSTPQQAVLDAIDRLGPDKNLSLVLNQSEKPEHDGYYYGSYGSEAGDMYRKQRKRPDGAQGGKSNATGSVRASAAVVALCAIQALAPAPAGAEVRVGVETGIGHSDNISRVSADPIDETIATIGLDLRFVDQGPRLNSNLAADLSYLSYLDDTYDEEVVGYLNGDFTFGLVPGRLEWYLEDRFGQARPNGFDAITPENRENINVLRTGPRIQLRFGSAAYMDITGRYTDIYYETSPTGSERVGGAISLGRQMSPTSRASINADFEQVEYDEAALDADYDHASAFLRYALSGSRTTLSADVGYTEIKPQTESITTDGATDKSTGLLLRVSATRQLSARSSLRLSLGRDSSDSADLFRLANQDPASAGGAGQGAVVPNGDTFESTYFQGGWNFEFNRTTAGLSADFYQERYDNDTDANRDRTLVHAFLTRELSRTVSVRAFGDWWVDDYLEADLKNTEWRFGLRASWQLGNNFSLNLQPEHWERTTSDGSAGANENRVWLTVSYERNR